MTPADRARERGITEILHYTSQRGVMGAVRKGAVLSREQVENDEDLAFIYEGIWPRKDPEWVDHISLSVSRINLDLFDRSRKRFPDYWWAIMSFGVEILDHDGVVFTTTNNIYPPCERGEDLEGFEAMFGSPIEWGLLRLQTRAPTGASRGVPDRSGGRGPLPDAPRARVPTEAVRPRRPASPTRRRVDRGLR